uniref:Putative RNA-dependent RNA polymerase n=1 Tax=Rhizoctonia solani partitivirus 11 TaxID=2870787 RepID=A0A8K1HVH9_9VIRU|nr:putative RNA-dependent RNA polymerase [Rhizoctonia solani partitivirus 11]
MEALPHLMDKLTFKEQTGHNFVFIGKYHRTIPRHIVFEPNIEHHQKTVRHAMAKYLYKEEYEMIIYDYRRSRATEDAILADFFNGDIPYRQIPKDEHYYYGLHTMLDLFRPPEKCRPVHLLDLMDKYPFKWQVNAEAPFSTDKYFLKQIPPGHGNKFGDMKYTIFQWTRRWHHVIKSGMDPESAGLTATDVYARNNYIFPMLLHTKTAIVKRDDPDKMRTIWGCSKPWILADAMFYWEYISWVKRNRGATPMLWGYETLTGGWLRLNDELYCSHLRQSFIMIDWKRFDKYAHFDLMHDIMYGVRDYLDFDNGYVPTINYPEPEKDWDSFKATRLQRLWLWTLDNLFNAPIVLPDGSMYRRLHYGIPSGLYITQLLDSWYNTSILLTILSAMGFKENEVFIIKVQGDDSIIRLGLLIAKSGHARFLELMQHFADHYFGSIISIDKSKMTNNLNECEVLSYSNFNGIPRRDEVKMLAQLYHTKAKFPTPGRTMAQCIGFAYASMGHNIRVLNVLQDVFEYYKRQGYSSDKQGLDDVFGDSPDMNLPTLDLNEFPKVSDIQKYYLTFDYVNEAALRRTWPDDYFMRTI